MARDEVGGGAAAKSAKRLLHGVAVSAGRGSRRGALSKR